jgi:hypothetical protein
MKFLGLDGVWLVELAASSDSQLVPKTVAQATLADKSLILPMKRSKPWPAQQGLWIDRMA